MKVWQLRKWLEEFEHDLYDDIEVTQDKITVSSRYYYNEHNMRMSRVED